MVIFDHSNGYKIPLAKSSAAAAVVIDLGAGRLHPGYPRVEGSMSRLSTSLASARDCLCLSRCTALLHLSRLDDHRRQHDDGSSECWSPSVILITDPSGTSTWQLPLDFLVTSRCFSTLSLLSWRHRRKLRVATAFGVAFSFFGADHHAASNLPAMSSTSSSIYPQASSVGRESERMRRNGHYEYIRDNFSAIGSMPARRAGPAAPRRSPRGSDSPPGRRPPRQSR